MKYLLLFVIGIRLAIIPVGFIEEAYNTAKRVLTEQSGKLKLLAERLIAQETIEGEALEALFSEAKPHKAARKVKKTSTPAPIEPVAEAEPAIKPKKTPVPKLVPEQTPAPSK